MERFSPAQIVSAIERLPRQASPSIRQVLANARSGGATRLVEACEAELQARGTLELSKADAEQAVRAARSVAGKSLREVIEIAFRDDPARPEEALVLRWLHRHPGGSHAELAAFYVKGDLSLVIGHLVYHRFGYFRPFLTGPIQSDLLLQRDRTSGRICYTLRPEAAAAFDALGLFHDAG